MTWKLIWNAWSFWLDLLENLRGRVQKNNVLKEVKFLQIWWEESENHYVKQTWKIGS